MSDRPEPWLPKPKPAHDGPPYYVYDRDAVIALNPIRERQGQKPLTGRETYEVVNGQRTGTVLGEDGKPL